MSRLRFRVPAISLTLAALIGTAVVPAAAQPIDVEDQLDRSALEAARREARELGTAKERQEQRLDVIQREISAVVEDYNVAAEELAAVEAEREDTQGELDQLTVEAKVLSDRAAGHVRRLHKLGGPGVELATMFASDSPMEAGTRSATLRRVIDAQLIDLQALTATKDAIAGAEQRLAELEVEAAERAAQVQAAIDALEATLAEHEDELRELEASFDTAQQLTVVEEQRLDEQRAELVAQELERRAEEQRRREAEERARREAQEAERARAAAAEREREVAAARQREAEAVEQARTERERRAAAQRQREAEAERQREAEAERQREADRQREAESQRQTTATTASAPSNSTSNSSNGTSSSSNGTSSSSSSTSSNGSSSSSSSSSTPAPSTARGSASVAVSAALSKQGAPYGWGSAGPNAFDCSGLTSWAWRQAGVTIPRSSSAQFGGLTKVSRAQLQPGDLVFYYSPISHVAMYIGGGQIVEASTYSRPVAVRSMDGPSRSPVGFARP